MKRRTLSFLLALATIATGCISQTLVEKHAKPHEKVVSREVLPGQYLNHVTTETVPGQSAYYALLPFTFVADVATSPVQVPVMIYYMIVKPAP